MVKQGSHWSLPAFSYVSPTCTHLRNQITSKKIVDGAVLRSCYQLSTLWLIGDTVGSLKSLWLHFFLAERLSHWTPQDLGKSFGAHIIRLFHCTVNGFPWQLWGLVLGCFSVDFGASIIMSHTHDPWRFGAFLLVQNTGRSEIYSSWW